MIATLSTGLSRCALIAALAIGTMALTTAHAGAFSAKVEASCAGDYFAYCSQHPVNGRGVRSCMRRNGNRLSTRCVNALVAAGEVSKKEVRRRSARR